MVTMTLTGARTLKPVSDADVQWIQQHWKCYQRYYGTARRPLLFAALRGHRDISFFMDVT